MKRCGEGEYKCPKCGKLCFGSTLHYCEESKGGEMTECTCGKTPSCILHPKPDEVQKMLEEIELLKTKKAVKNYDQIYKNLDDAELKVCYDELIEFQNTGVLKDGKVREICRKVKEVVPINNDVRLVERDLLQEMAKRWRDINENCLLSRKE